MGVLRAATDLKIQVPLDLSVIGVDNHDMAYLFELTTISQPVRDEGRLAAQLLLRQIAQPIRDSRPPDRGVGAHRPGDDGPPRCVS